MTNHAKFTSADVETFLNAEGANSILALLACKPSSRARFDASHAGGLLQLSAPLLVRSGFSQTQNATTRLVFASVANPPVVSANHTSSSEHEPRRNSRDCCPGADPVPVLCASSCALCCATQSVFAATSPLPWTARPLAPRASPPGSLYSRWRTEPSTSAAGARGPCSRSSLRRSSWPAPPHASNSVPHFAITAFMDLLNISSCVRSIVVPRSGPMLVASQFCSNETLTPPAHARLGSCSGLASGVFGNGSTCSFACDPGWALSGPPLLCLGGAWILQGAPQSCSRKLLSALSASWLPHQC